jgi:hypothetical protein
VIAPQSAGPGRSAVRSRWPVASAGGSGGRPIAGIVAGTGDWYDERAVEGLRPAAAKLERYDLDTGS